MINQSILGNLANQHTLFRIQADLSAQAQAPTQLQGYYRVTPTVSGVPVAQPQDDYVPVILPLTPEQQQALDTLLTALDQVRSNLLGLNQAPTAQWKPWRTAMLSNEAWNTFRGSATGTVQNDLSMMYALLVQVETHPDTVDEIALLLGSALTLAGVSAEDRTAWADIAVQHNLPAVIIAAIEPAPAPESEPTP